MFRAGLSEGARLTPRERFLRAARGQDVDRPPVWLMRQAGRYLPEYREIRAAKTFEERLTNPEIAAEITLQPLRRFPLDGAILFSDILVPLTGMGRPATFDEHGPRIQNPIRTPQDVAGLHAFDPHAHAPYVLDSIARVRKALPDHAVLGFAGAPFTLASYLIEGATSKGFQETKRFCYHNPEAWNALMRACADAASAHLEAQIEVGCDAVQLFDTWAEHLAPSEYEEHALPHVQRILQRAKAKGVPVIYFARGTPHLLPLLPQTGADIWSIDWRVPIENVRQAYPKQTLQGNLDPTLLFAPPRIIQDETRAMLDALQGRAHIANLGHGILPGTPIESVETFVRTVTEWSA